MNICIIQLTRIGDILQTYQAAKQLKCENPDIKLTLITRRRFSSQLDFLLKETFDNIIEFETKDFFQGENPNLKDVRIKLHNFVHDIKKLDFNLVVNLSFTKASSFLTTLISQKLKMGIYRNNIAQIGIDDKWSQYVYSNILESSSSPFNLVDIYKSMLGAKEIDVTNFLTPKNKVITIHPFASHIRKAWPTAKWSELIYKLLKEDKEVEINIVGSSADKDDLIKITSNPSLEIYNRRINSHVGKGTIEDTFNILADSHLFIGHDSMVSHLAAILRMPSVILSLGTVKPHETTPYNDRAVNLAPRNKCFPCNLSTSCELLPCHGSITPQTVTAVSQNIIEHGQLEKEKLLSALSSFHLDSTNIYTASFDKAGLSIKELSGNDQNINETFRTYYRILWSYYFKGLEINTDIPKLDKEAVKQLNFIGEGVKHLFELYSHGFQFCNQILDESEKDSPSIQSIQDTVTKLAEVDSLISTTKGVYPQLSSLADFFFVNKANAAGNNIIEITNNNLIAFHEASNLTAILDDLLHKTIGPRVEGESTIENV